MEAVLMNTTGDHNYNHRIGNPKRNFLVNNRSLYSYRSDDLLLASFMAGSRFAGGSLLSMPPPAGSVLGAPPLLPLPISMPLNHQNMNMNTNIYRSNSSSNNNSSCNNNYQLSPPRINKNVKNRGRDHSLTPKKSKNQKKNSKKEEVDLIPQKEKEKAVTDQMIGPDPEDLPKDVISRVFASSINKSDIVSVDVDKFSGSVVFTPSPPPSSLPLPTFSLRPKLSCKAKARGSSTILGYGVDDGATDSLRRLLRL